MRGCAWWKELEPEARPCSRECRTQARLLQAGLADSYPQHAPVGLPLNFAGGSLICGRHCERAAQCLGVGRCTGPDGPCGHGILCRTIHMG